MRGGRALFAWASTRLGPVTGLGQVERGLRGLVCTQDSRPASPPRSKQVSGVGRSSVLIPLPLPEVNSSNIEAADKTLKKSIVNNNKWNNQTTIKRVANNKTRKTHIYKNYTLTTQKLALPQMFTFEK